MTLSSLTLSAATGKRAAVLAATSLLAATALAGAALAQEVKIGIVGGISGPIAALAPPMIQASKLAVEHVNAQGGILDGRKLVAVVGDSACSQQGGTDAARSEEHTSELQSLMRISYAVFCLIKKKHYINFTKE